LNRGLPIYMLGLIACGTPVSVVAPLGVVYTSPASGDAGVSIDSDVVVVFSAPLDEESVSASSVWLSDDQGAAVSSSISLDEDAYGLVLTPEVDLEEVTSYTVHLTTDLSSSVSGWLPTDILIGFTTAGETTDENVQPTADAGTDVEIVLGESAQLDGTMSSDPEGAPLTYDWSVTSEGIGANELLSDTTSATPLLTPVAAGSLVVGLAVNDGEWESDRVYFTATVTKSTTASE
jgi:hypothetical protein